MYSLPVYQEFASLRPPLGGRTRLVIIIIIVVVVVVVVLQMDLLHPVTSLFFLLVKTFKSISHSLLRIKSSADDFSEYKKNVSIMLC